MATILLRRDTAANWQSVNPVLAQGELGVETDTGKAKLGDGTTAWNDLAYFKDVVFEQTDKDNIQTALSQAHSHANKALLDALTNSGDGTKFLSDDGTYKVVDGGGTATFTGLTDTPASYTGAGGKIVAVNSGETGLEFIDTPSGGGASTFDELTDTPATKIAGKYVRVSADGLSLEYDDGTAPITISGAVTVADNTALRNYTGMVDGDIVYMMEWGRGNGKGGGWFVYRENMNQSAHDGGWFFKSNTGTGVWERIGMKRGYYCVYDFGAVGSRENFTSYSSPVNPLSLYYATLAEAQEDYPFVDSLDIETDWCAWRQMNASEEWYWINEKGASGVSARLCMYDSSGDFYFNRELWVRAIEVHWDLPLTRFYWVTANDVKGTKDDPIYVLRFENRFLAVHPNNPYGNYSIPYPDNWEADPAKGWYESSAGTAHRYSYWANFHVFNRLADNAQPDPDYISGMLVQGFEANCEFFKLEVDAMWDGFVARGFNMLSTFTNCRFSGVRDAFAQLHGKGNIATTVYLRDCEFFNFGRYGMYLYTLGTWTSFTVDNCDVEGRLTYPYFGGIFTNDTSWFYQGVRAAFFCQGGDIICRHLRFEDIGDDYAVHVEGLQNFFEHCYFGGFNGSIFTMHVTGADGTLHTPDWENHMATRGWVDITDNRNAYVYAGPDNVVDQHPGTVRFENMIDMGRVYTMQGMNLSVTNFFSTSHSFPLYQNQTLPASETSGLPPKSDFAPISPTFSDDVIGGKEITILSGGTFDTPTGRENSNLVEGISIGKGAFSFWKDSDHNKNKYTVCGVPFTVSSKSTMPNEQGYVMQGKQYSTVLDFIEPLAFFKNDSSGNTTNYLESYPFRKQIIRQTDPWNPFPKYTEDSDRGGPFIEGDIFLFKTLSQNRAVGSVCTVEGEYAQTWAEGLVISLAEKVRPVLWNGHVYEAQNEGMTCDVEPSFPTSTGGSVTESPGYPQWAASTAYNAGDKIMPSTSNGFFYECTTAGTSGTTEPTWPTTNGATVTDGTVVWTARQIVTWVEAGANFKWEFFGRTYNSDRFSGSSAGRPVGVEVGFQYFDTDLGKPIYWDGSQWVDANGTAV